MTNKMCHKNLHLVLFILSILLLRLKTATSTSVNHRHVPAVAHYKCIEKERDALLDFKAHIQDPGSWLSTWTTEKEEDYECCNWDGVTCNNEMGHVIELDLSSYSLGGKISPSFLNLSYLSYLNLAFNSFYGTIPMFIGSMTELSYLDLSDNSFSGMIPSSIGSLTKLTNLDLSHNSFSGMIPSSIGSLTKLTHLDLSANSFSGTIPSSIGSLTSLTYLDLYNNSFSGTIPASIGSLSRLTNLDLSYNYLLNGTCIPSELRNLTNLQYLSLRGLTSCIVENIDWLSHMSDLNILIMDDTSMAKADKWVNVILSLKKLSLLSLSGCDLSEVMHPYSSQFLKTSSSSIDSLYLADNNLNSSMYHWLFPLTSNKLHELYLSGNMLDGKSFGNLCSLTSFHFANNSVVVKFPDFLNNWSGCKSVALQYLYAPYSRITGSLSDEIQMFTSLEDLYLDHNDLNGPISEKVWELPKLQSLGISSNYLRGPISENIGKSKIYNIYLSNNLIKGVLSEAHMSNFSYVNQIDLSSCNLGPRFPKWILNFKNLSGINIGNNSISDTIPVEFWKNWPSQLAYLNLSTNNMSGEVPDLLSSFHPNYFSQIDLSSNNFSGHILNVPPSSIHLDLSRNKFHGGLSFLCQIATGLLRYLDLSRNSFIGKIPDCLWYFKELEVLNLGYNNLSGMLPASIESLIGLEVLCLYNNNFSGELPFSLKNSSKLTFFDLGSNKFTGRVPHWIGESLSRLYVLSLASNKLLGPIPLQLCKLANLQILDLSMNNLYGTIPSCVNNLSTMAQEGFLQQNVHRVLKQPGSGYEEDFYVDHAMIHWQGNLREFSTNLGFLKSIDLSQNNLTGPIPHEITHLCGLHALNLSNNALDGKIPWKIDEMRNLLALDVSRNNLSGEIPQSMSKMNSLDHLNVSYNNLSGRIPSSTQLQSFEPSCYTGNAELCGLPLTKYCPGDIYSEVPRMVGESEDDKKEIDELWRWFYIGSATGFPIGFWIVCGTLLLNRHARHAFLRFLDSLQDMFYVEVVVFIVKLRRFACTYYNNCL